MHLRCTHISWKYFCRDYLAILFHSESTSTIFLCLTVSTTSFLFSILCLSLLTTLMLIFDGTSDFSLFYQFVPSAFRFSSWRCCHLFFPVFLPLTPILNLLMTRVESMQKRYWYPHWVCAWVPYLTKLVTFNASFNTTYSVYQSLLLPVLDTIPT